MRLLKAKLFGTHPMFMGYFQLFVTKISIDKLAEKRN
jgi:hypothetical protein